MIYLNQYIGNYKIVSLIKSGGMADVYLGEDINTQDRVAIKILKADYKNDLDVVRRFYIEGAVLEKFDHPNIVKFLFNTDINGQPVMVMEYLEGYDMNELLNKKEPVAINLIADYFLQVLDAVIYAHAKNVVHRDIKPSNIFITTDGVVKLLDFGIAKILLDNLDQTKTGFGQFTPTYMSPEQASIKKYITEKSYIYSLGVTLFSLVNGKNPYQEMSAFVIGHQVLHEPLPALVDYPYLNNVIARATAKSIYERYTPVEEFKNSFYRAVNKRASIENLNNEVNTDVNNDINQALKLFGVFLAVIVLFGIMIYPVVYHFI
jgi:serine/threonine-protein kinase